MDNKIVKIDLECTNCKRNAEQLRKIDVGRVIQKLDSCFATNDLDSANSLLEYWQNEAINIGDLSGELSIVNELLGLTRKRNDKVGGQRAADRALELIALNNNQNSVSGATIILNAATTCKEFGNIEKALELYEKALEIYSEKLPENDLKFAALYNNYATTLVDTGCFERAYLFYMKAAQITGQNINSLLDCAITYVNLAHFYENRDGLYSEDIEKCLKKAEEIFENEKIERNAYYAFVCDKCAASFDYFGFFYYANELYKRARYIYEGN